MKNRIPVIISLIILILFATISTVIIIGNSNKPSYNESYGNTISSDKVSSDSSTVATTEELVQDDNFTELDPIMEEKVYDVPEDVDVSENIEVPEAETLEPDTNKLQTVIKDLMDNNGYVTVETLVEEENIGAGRITYIVRFDNSVYYHISVYSDNQIISEYDEYGLGPDIWEEIQSAN